MNGDELLYLRCPSCGSRIKEPFNAGGDPQVWVHPCPGRRKARLIVVPRMRMVYEIPEDVSLETELLRAIGRTS